MKFDRHITGEITSSLQHFISPDDNSKSPKTKLKELSKSTMRRDEKDVTKIIFHVKENMVNPFSKAETSRNEDVLVNIGTGRHAFKEVQTSLLNCVKAGENKVFNFIDNTLDTNGNINFHDPLKHVKLLTFADMNKKIKLKSSNGVKLALTSPELIMRRGLALIKHRPELTLLDIISVPTGGAPLVISLKMV